MAVSGASAATTGFLTAKDGTRIGFRRMGAGPGVILLHGGMQSGLSFTTLGGLLADRFTTYSPDRRGRGLSGPVGETYGLMTEVDDLHALLDETGARDVFGLSSGALIAMQAALTWPDLRKLALYEPPLEIEGAPKSPLDWAPRYEKALARGDLGAAMVATLKGTGDREFMTAVPSFLLTPFFRLMIRAQAEQGEAEALSLQTLIPTLQHDIRVTAEMAGTAERFTDLRIETLLLGGSRSAAYLGAALDVLETALPNCRRVELPGLGHIAADDRGDPLPVAAALRDFFA